MCTTVAPPALGSTPVVADSAPLSHVTGCCNAPGAGLQFSDVAIRLGHTDAVAALGLASGTGLEFSDVAVRLGHADAVAAFGPLPLAQMPPCINTFAAAFMLSPALPACAP